MADRRFRDLVRLNETQRATLFNRMDKSAQAESAQVIQRGAEARAYTRFEYRQGSLPVAVEHPGGGFTTLLVCARNISSGGMAFLNGGYLHGSTRCKIILSKVGGGRIVVDGQVVNSRHLQGALHEVSVRFDERIDLDAVLPPEEQRPIQSDDKSTQPQFEGRALVVGSDAEFAEQMLGWVRSTGLQVDAVRRASAAVEAVSRSPHVAVILDLDLSTDSAVDTVRNIRDSGHAGAIVVFTEFGAGSAESRFAAVREAGATHLLFKPCRDSAVYEVLEAICTGRTGSPPSSDAVEPGDDDDSRSTSNEQMATRRFLDRLRRLAEDLEQAIEEASLSRVRALCEQARAEWPGGGFDKLLRSADATFDAIDKAGVIDDVTAQVRQFALLCATASEPRTTERDSHGS